MLEINNIAIDSTKPVSRIPNISEESVKRQNVLVDVSLLSLLQQSQQFDCLCELIYKNARRMS